MSRELDQIINEGSLSWDIPGPVLDGQPRPGGVDGNDVVGDEALPTTVPCDCCGASLGEGDEGFNDLRVRMSFKLLPASDPMAATLLEWFKYPVTRGLVRCISCVEKGEVRSMPSFRPPASGRRR